MSPENTFALAGFLLAGLTQAVILAIWGSRLTNRVLNIEREIAPLKALPVQITRIETRQETWIEQLKDLNASVRWLRDPADYGANAPPPAKPRSKP